MCQRNGFDKTIEELPGEIINTIVGGVFDTHKQSELDMKIEMVLSKMGVYAWEGAKLTAKGGRAMFLSVYYGIKEAKHYSIRDVGLLTLALVPSVLLREYNIIPLLYTPISFVSTAVVFRGIRFLGERWLFDRTMRKCQITTENNKKPALKGIRYEGKRKTFILNSSIPLSKFGIFAKKIKSTSNICLLNTEQQNKKILLHTRKKAKLSEEYQEIGKYLEVFESLELPIIIKDYEITEYFTNVYFNTDIFFNKLQNITPELTHRLKVKSLEITTGSKFDYKLTVKKEIKKKVTFISVWDSEEVQARIKDMIIPVLMGVNCETGEIALYDMARDMYHQLIAGTTGWGKSVLLQNICSSILLADRDNVKCYFYDVKGTELNLYEGLDNVYFEKDQQKIVLGLEKSVDEMNIRNAKINKNRFNRNIWSWNKENPDDQMDLNVIVVEEISFFMESSDAKLKKRFVSAIVKLTQLGRSAGFWVTLTTQNPVKDVITGEIKANIGTREGHFTTDKTKSRTILDNNMCAEIDQKGKYVLQNLGKNTLHRSYWIQDEESKIIYYRIKSYMRNQGEKHEKPEITNDSIGLMENSTGLMKNSPQPEGVIINNTYNLYLFYKNIQQDNGKLPVKKELIELTGLTDWKLRNLHDKLKQEGKLINQGNDLILVDDVDELAKRRIIK